MEHALILVIDDNRSSLSTIRAILAPDGFTIEEAGDAKPACERLESGRPDLVILDVKVNGRSRPDLVDKIHERVPHTPIILLTESRDNRVVGQAMRRGIFGYQTKPMNAADLRLTVNRALEDKRLKDEVMNLKEQLEERQSLYTRMGNSEQVQNLVHLLEKIAPTLFTVLIEGESGAGKELVARAIHDLSTVRNGPFVAVDCGAIPETLFESELFGYVKGAFTGAGANKTGFFEAADQGTLFLDEVCNLPYTSQQKLLRAIEERCVQRIGSTVSTPVNVRIVAATNRSLEHDVEARLFRVDLLYRLKEVSVRVPPLRERPEDICYLAQRFLEEFKDHIGVQCPGFSQRALSSLMAYPWPGNVRELRNTVRQAVLTCENNQYIAPAFLPFIVREHSSALTGETANETALPEEADTQSRNPVASCLPPVAPRLAEGQSLADFIRLQSTALERTIISQTLEDCGYNKVRTAKRLQIDYKTLYRKIKAMGLE